MVLMLTKVLIYTLVKQVIILRFIIIINNKNNVINNNIIIESRKGSTHAVILRQPLGDVVGTPPHPARMASVFEQEMVFQGPNLKPQEGMVSDYVFVWFDGVNI